MTNAAELPLSAQRVIEAVETIEPLDEIEKTHKADTLAWVRSAAPIFRVAKPDKPPRHLVSYFVVVDAVQRSLLLVDHLKSGLWLPTGGHVDPDEDPRVTVEREMAEELRRPAHFTQFAGKSPVFITWAVTVGSTAGHTDVSLWYVLEGTSGGTFDFDRGEFKGVKWFSFDEVLQMDLSMLDPNMHRFTRKLISLLHSEQ